MIRNLEYIRDNGMKKFLRKQEKKYQELHENKDDIAWGSQIRSYVMQPYQMVKDLRTGKEIGNVQGVLDGDLDRYEVSNGLRAIRDAELPAG